MHTDSKWTAKKNPPTASVVLPQACPPGGGHELFLVLETLKVDGQELRAGNLEQKGETFEPIWNTPVNTFQNWVANSKTGSLNSSQLRKYVNEDHPR